MLVTEFLGMYTSDLSRELLTQAAEMKAYLSVLADQLRAAASKLESGLLQGYHCRCELITRSDVLIEDHPALTIEIPRRTARPIGTEDGCLLDAVIRNSLPSVCVFKPFPIV